MDKIQGCMEEECDKYFEKIKPQAIMVSYAYICEEHYGTYFVCVYGKTYPLDQT